MRLLHGNEMHFVRCPDGRVYSTGVAVYPWWTDYLRVFDEVVVVSRIKQVTEMWAPERVAEGPGIQFVDLPDFRGPEDYLRHSGTVHEILRKAICDADAYMFRVPGTIGYLGAREVLRQGGVYSLEVVGDPYDVFAPGSVRHPLRAFFRRWHTHNLRTYCRGAAATMYVTEHALQRRYPPCEGTYSVHYSDVELNPASYATSPRVLASNPSPVKLIFVGTLEQLYKAPDVLIDAVHLCREEDLDIELTFAGEGACQKMLEERVKQFGLFTRVHFAGHVAGRQALLNMLDESDIFVLPSRAEGLPRAMIEAMARALPCIGSTVDGIPELLHEEDLVPPDDARALADKIRDVATDPVRRSRMSERNLITSKEYRVDIMLERKLEFCQYVRHQSASVCKTKGGVPEAV
jgi:glycosyltransferase involved in cell wall biosynthesis